MVVCKSARVMQLGVRGRHVRAGIFFLVVVAAGLSSPLTADQGKPSKVKNGGAVSLAEAVRLATDPDERAQKIVVFRRRMLELDLEAWQGLIDGDFDAACEAKADEVRQVTVAFGNQGGATRYAFWGAQSFDAVQKLSTEQREIVRQAVRSDRSGQRLKTQGSTERARVHFRLAEQKLRDTLGIRSQITFHALHRLADAEAELHDLDAACSLRRAMLEGAAQELDEKNPYAAWASGQMALLEERMNRPHEAEERWRQIIDTVEPLMVDNPDPFVSQLYVLGEQHLAQMANDRGEYSIAEGHAREALAVAAISCAVLPTADSRAAIALTEVELAISFAGQGRATEADRAFDAVLRLINCSPEEMPPVDLRVRVLSAYAEHCRRSRRSKDADKLEAKIARIKSSEKSPAKIVERPEGAEDKRTK